MALKLWIGMMSLVTVVLILLWLFQIVFLGKFYTNIRISDIKKEGFNIIKQLEMENPLEFEEKAEALAYNNNAIVELIDLEGYILYTTNTGGMHGRMGMGMGMMNNNLRTQVYNQALEGKTALESVSNHRFGSETILIGLPVLMSGEVQGVFLMELPMAPVHNTVDILKRQLIYIIVILLVAALIVSFLLSKSFTRPILDIINVSEKMAEGNLSARVLVRSQDEIGRLAGTINHMGSELFKIDQLRKDLIANVSHELRTPLSLIKGYAETIRDVSGEQPEKRDRHIQIIIEESDRLSYMVDDVLNLSQMQAGYTQLEEKTFVVSELLEHTTKKYEIESSKREIDIHLKNTKDILVKADEAKIQQVLYNLINNAFNHVSPKGTIIVSALPKEDAVRIEVFNTGEEIPPDEIDHIWDRFYKIDKARQRSMAGTGIGLAIVKNILQAHKFEHGVESKSGDGTRFWFEIKRAK